MDACEGCMYKVLCVLRAGGKSSLQFLQNTLHSNSTVINVLYITCQTHMKLYKHTAHTLTHTHTHTHTHTPSHTLTHTLVLPVVEMTPQCPVQFCHAARRSVWMHDQCVYIQARLMFKPQSVPVGQHRCPVALEPAHQSHSEQPTAHTITCMKKC